MLDRTQQRILGVLIEKELSVPDSYPMTENALLLGCNQKSNREPEMALESFEISGALMAMRLDGWVVKTEGGRADRYRHEVDKKLGLDLGQKAVLAELLLRGPQAAGALKPRVARMGLHATPEQLETLLQGLRERGTPLVELLPLRPRERDERWAHLLGPRDPADEHAASDPPRPQGSSRANDVETRLTQLEREVSELRDGLGQLRALLGKPAPPATS